MRWHVCTAGYSLEKGDDGELLLRPKSPFPWDLKEYDPEKGPPLFRAFAMVDTPEKCLKFASLRGLLFQHSRLPKEVVQFAPAERVRDWLAEAAGVRAVLKLNDIVAHGTGEEATRAVVTVMGGAVAVEKMSLEHKKQLLAGTLRDFVNEKLSRWVHPSLRHVPGEPWYDVELAPDTLCGVIWLQVFRYLAGLVEPRHCAYCGKTFWIRKDSDGRRTRSDARYCPGGACKQAAYRARKAQQARAGL